MFVQSQSCHHHQHLPHYCRSNSRILAGWYCCVLLPSTIRLFNLLLLVGLSTIKSLSLHQYYQRIQGTNLKLSCIFSRDGMGARSWAGLLASNPLDTYSQYRKYVPYCTCGTYSIKPLRVTGRRLPIVIIQYSTSPRANESFPTF